MAYVSNVSETQLKLPSLKAKKHNVVYKILYSELLSYSAHINKFLEREII